MKWWMRLRISCCICSRPTCGFRNDHYDTPEVISIDVNVCNDYGFATVLLQSSIFNIFDAQVRVIRLARISKWEKPTTWVAKSTS